VGMLTNMCACIVSGGGGGGETLCGERGTGAIIAANLRKYG
jgi:hypothetical protein